MLHITGDFESCQAAVPQALKGPKNAKLWWRRSIRLVTF